MEILWGQIGWKAWGGWIRNHPRTLGRPIQIRPCIIGRPIRICPCILGRPIQNFCSQFYSQLYGSNLCFHSWNKLYYCSKSWRASQLLYWFKSLAILLNKWILPTGGAASGRVYIFSLHSRLVYCLVYNLLVIRLNATFCVTAGQFFKLCLESKIIVPNPKRKLLILLLQ